MTEKEYDQGRIRRRDAAHSAGWKSCVVRPEHRGAESQPNGWFKNGVVVTFDGMVHYPVEPYHVELKDFLVVPSDKNLAIMQEW